MSFEATFPTSVHAPSISPLLLHTRQHPVANIHASETREQRCYSTSPDKEMVTRFLGGGVVDSATETINVTPCGDEPRWWWGDVNASPHSEKAVRGIEDVKPDQSNALCSGDGNKVCNPSQGPGMRIDAPMVSSHDGAPSADMHN